MLGSGSSCGQEGAKEVPWGVTRSDGVCRKTTLAAVWGQEDIILGDDNESAGGDDESLNPGRGAQVREKRLCTIARWRSGEGC